MRCVTEWFLDPWQVASQTLAGSAAACLCDLHALVCGHLRLALQTVAAAGASPVINIQPIFLADSPEPSCQRFQF